MRVTNRTLWMAPTDCHQVVDSGFKRRRTTCWCFPRRSDQGGRLTGGMQRNYISRQHAASSYSSRMPAATQRVPSSLDGQQRPPAMAYPRNNALRSYRRAFKAWTGRTSGVTRCCIRCGAFQMPSLPHLSSKRHLDIGRAVALLSAAAFPRTALAGRFFLSAVLPAYGR